jgi:hypothetical protein
MIQDDPARRFTAYWKCLNWIGIQNSLSNILHGGDNGRQRDLDGWA